MARFIRWVYELGYIHTFPPNIFGPGGMLNSSLFFIFIFFFNQIRSAFLEASTHLRICLQTTRYTPPSRSLRAISAIRGPCDGRDYALAEYLRRVWVLFSLVLPLPFYFFLFYFFIFFRYRKTFQTEMEPTKEHTNPTE